MKVRERPNRASASERPRSPNEGRRVAPSSRDIQFAPTKSCIGEPVTSPPTPECLPRHDDELRDACLGYRPFREGNGPRRGGYEDSPRGQRTHHLCRCYEAAPTGPELTTPPRAAVRGPQRANIGRPMNGRPLHGVSARWSSGQGAERSRIMSGHASAAGSTPCHGAPADCQNFGATWVAQVGPSVRCENSAGTCAMARSGGSPVAGHLAPSRDPEREAAGTWPSAGSIRIADGVLRSLRGDRSWTG